MAIFIYEDPFIIDPKVKMDYILPTMDDYDRQSEKKIHELIFKFAASEGLITEKMDELVMNPGEDSGSWKWLIITMNFRSMVMEDQYNKFMHALVMGENRPIDKIIDLHFRLGSLFEHVILNTIVDRLYKSIALIPYSDDTDKKMITWDIIHSETPFVWVCILTQILLRTEFVKNVGE